MNIRNVAEAIEVEVTQAYRDNSPSASLEELEMHLNIMHRKVARLAHKARMAHDNDSPDVMTCCNLCGDMMPTPERGGSYICTECGEQNA